LLFAGTITFTAFVAPGGSRGCNTEHGATIGPRKGRYESRKNIILIAAIPTRIYNTWVMLFPKRTSNGQTSNTVIKKQLSAQAIRRPIDTRKRRCLAYSGDKIPSNRSVNDILLRVNKYHKKK
jgi:hypothetical protein